MKHIAGIKHQRNFYQNKRPCMPLRFRTRMKLSAHRINVQYVEIFAKLIINTNETSLFKFYYNFQFSEQTNTFFRP